MKGKIQFFSITACLIVLLGISITLVQRGCSSAPQAQPIVAQAQPGATAPVAEQPLQVTVIAPPQAPVQKTSPNQEFLDELIRQVKAGKNISLNVGQSAKAQENAKAIESLKQQLGLSEIPAKAPDQRKDAERKALELQDFISQLRGKISRTEVSLVGMKADVNVCPDPGVRAFRRLQIEQFEESLIEMKANLAELRAQLDTAKSQVN